MKSLKKIVKDVVLKEGIEYKDENIPKDVKEFIDKKELMEFVYTPWDHRGEDKVENVCGFCGERSEEPEIEEDYTNKYGQFFCNVCHKACVLCVNIEDFHVNCEIMQMFRKEDGLERIEYDNTCCVKRDKDRYTCYPIVIEYMIKSNDEREVGEIESFFGIEENEDDVNEIDLERKIEDNVRSNELTEDKIIERFMKSEYKEKYRIEPTIEIDLEEDYWMFVGRCTNCKKMRTGVLWGD